MVRTGILTLIVMLGTLLLVACGNDEGPELVPPTPGAGTPAVEATQGFAEPVEASPNEGDQVPGDPVQEGEVDSPETGASDMSPEVVFGADIPLPESATPVNTELVGPNVSTVTFEVPGMSGDELVSHFESAMPEAGYELSAEAGGEESNNVWSFSGNGIAGTLTVVDEGSAGEPARFIISMDTPTS